MLVVLWLLSVGPNVVTFRWHVWDIWTITCNYNGLYTFILIGPMRLTCTSKKFKKITVSPKIWGRAQRQAARCRKSDCLFWSTTVDSPSRRLWMLQNASSPECFNWSRWNLASIFYKQGSSFIRRVTVWIICVFVLLLYFLVFIFQCLHVFLLCCT